MAGDDGEGDGESALTAPGTRAIRVAATTTVAERRASGSTGMDFLPFLRVMDRRRTVRLTTALSAACSGARRAATGTVGPHRFVHGHSARAGAFRLRRAFGGARRAGQAAEGGRVSGAGGGAP
ncbi:hypothetical protein GCM10009544_04940 [Streptomyces stramineus]|uniref:Uncharacterized protein n=1 Tax=Streptomyces stramineus TaxID=173861 RepID=A0ABP3J9M1_9ACTN